MSDVVLSDAEKHRACLDAAGISMVSGDLDGAVDTALKALSLFENDPEAFFILAKCHYFMAMRGGVGSRRNWERCVHFAREGIAKSPSGSLAASFDIHRFLNVALNAVGDVRGAADSCTAALAVKPDPHLESNLLMYRKFLSRVRLAEAVDEYVLAHGPDSGPSSAISNASLFASGRSFPGVRGRTPGSPDLVIYTGRSFERWNPETALRNGIGGSETAVIEMARRLRSRGVLVRVYGDCAGIDGTFDGVEYVDHSKYGDISCDILITSRRPFAVDETFGIRSHARVCWVHDVHMGDELTPERSERIDLFLTLSQWHRNFFLGRYPQVRHDRAVVTRNGIDVTRFRLPDADGTLGVLKNPFRAVYSSNPDRGMDVAISVWPRVRERLPEAELHLYYGFQTWASYADAEQRKAAELLEWTARNREFDGVFYHGRVPQSVLAGEYLKSGVWAYPTAYFETSCISAMEAHAAGLRMVTSPIGALNETVGGRGVLIPGDNSSEDYRDRFVNSVVTAMTRSGDLDRLELRRHAFENFGWDSLADEWIPMLEDVVRKK